jgi:1-acyl-sn-glycerol-3-phosphate acyltransferase
MQAQEEPHQGAAKGPDTDALGRAVAELCADLAPVPQPVPGPGVQLSDLGFDSLAAGDLSAALEERFGVRLADGDVEAVRTVGDVTATVRSTMPDRERIPPGVGRLQQPAVRLAGWAFRWYAHLIVEGRENVPPGGPVILAANHRSMLDVPLMVLACPRSVTFMAKQELFGGPVRRWAFNALGGFPVKREIADIRAMDTGLAVLQQGDVLGLYPEGTRSKTGQMLPFLRGAAWLALKVGAPIVPCGISGTPRSGRFPDLRKRVRIVFGPRIEAQRVDEPRRRRERAEDLTADLLEGIIAIVR